MTVGDFENDIDMFTAADISFAVANAPEHVKAFATRTTVSTVGGAIAEVIKFLENLQSAAI